MKIDVLLGEAPAAPADVADRVVVVIDVLRAASTAATALANGARALLPFESVDAAAQQAKSMESSTMRKGGERHMVRVPGFDFGNSPLEYTRALVEGRTIVFTTTNGTLALTTTQRARECFFSGFVNATATVQAVLATAKPGTSDASDVLIICAGSDRHLSFEDAVCAGRLVRGLSAAVPTATLGDGARIAEMIERPYRDSTAALSEEATHARNLLVAGFADDVAYCLRVDTVPLAVSYRNRQLRAYQSVAAAD